MKAILCTKYGPPEVLQLREVDKPVPKDNELLIKIFATSVTASDCLIRAFNVPLLLRLPMGLAIGFGKPRQPILGMILAGEVEATGTAVKRFNKGDQVFAFNIVRFGAYAEYICMPEDGVISLKPSNLSFEEAAAIPYGGMIALQFLKKGNLQSGERILIYGASGANGTSAVQLARNFGARVTGVCSSVNVELVKSLGAEAVYDYTKDDLTNLIDRYDFIFDAVGKRKSATFQGGKMLKREGRYISVDDGSPKLHVEDLIYLKELAEAGKFIPVIDRTYPLEQIVDAHRYVDMGHKKGNVVITVISNQ